MAETSLKEFQNATLTVIIVNHYITGYHLDNRNGEYRIPSLRRMLSFPLTAY